MALTKRSGKGSALTNTELDANFTHLGGDGTFPVPSTKGTAGQVLKMNAGATALEFATDATGTGGIASVVADTSPQLGGSLDVNGQSIVSASAGNIAITPDGAGKVILDGLSHPTADGTSGQALTTDGSGNLAFNTLASSLAIQDEGSVLSSAPSILNFVGNGVTVTGNGNSTKTITISGGGGAGSTVYNNASSLPLSGNSDGDMAFAKDTNRLYVWNGAGWYSIALVNAAPTISSGATSLNLATDGTATVVTITATDPEGAPLTYAYSVTGGSLTNGGGATATVVQGSGANINKFTITPTTTEGYAGTFTLTFTASDGVSTATSPATYTLVFALPQHRSTALKVKTSGTNGRNNSVFDDASTTNHAITSNGASYQSTVTPYTPLGQWSTYFGGDDIVHFTHASDFNFGNGDFCCEAWVKQEAVNQGAYGESVIFTTSQGADSQGISLHLSAGTTLFILAGAGSWVMNTGAIAGAVLEIGKWHHIAFTRHSNNIYLYFDGRQVHTQSFTTTLTNTNNKFAIGGRNAPAAHYFRGWISNVRVVKGASVYNGASGIKPPTDALTAVSGTVLLTCNGNRFEDFSGGNAKTVAFISEPIISDLSPVKIADIWKTSLGGSVYFDGIVGTYLSLPDSSEFDLAASASGGDFTLECWAYADGAQGAYDCIMSFAQDGVAGGYNLITGGNPAKFHYNIAGGVDSTTNFVKNTWVHLALVRSGSAAANVKLYINGVADATTKSNTGAHAANNQPRIGQYPNMTIRMFKGYIADVRLVNGTAVYTSNFTPPTAPLPIVANTKLKLNFDQAGVFDSVSNSRLQLYGDAKESTTQTKYATTSVVFDGTGDYAVSEGDHFKVGTGAFQFEAWVRWTSGAGGIFHVAQASIGSGNQANTSTFGLGVSANNKWIIYHNGQTEINSVVSADTWYHVAYVRQSGKRYVLIDGVEIHSAADTFNYSATDTFNLGGWYSTGFLFNGYIEDARFLSGHTTYPNERPQTALTAVSGTTLQLANSSTIPSSPNGLTLTASEGSPTVSPFTPPDSTVSHSIYYDGSDMHTVSANTNIHLGTGDFTIEGYFWIVAQVGTYDALFGTRAANDTNGFGMSYTASNMYVYSAAYLVNNIPFEYKKWMHLAYQRKTISGTATHQMFRDGVLVGSGTTARTFANNPLFIGGDLAGSENSNVYISDFRVVKGTAVYDTSFTPPGQAL